MRVVPGAMVQVVRFNPFVPDLDVELTRQPGLVVSDRGLHDGPVGPGHRVLVLFGEVLRSVPIGWLEVVT